MKTCCVFLSFLLVFCVVDASEPSNEDSKLSKVVLESGCFYPLGDGLAGIYSAEEKSCLIVFSKGKKQFWVSESEQGQKSYLETDDEGVLVLTRKKPENGKDGWFSPGMKKMKEIIG